MNKPINFKQAIIAVLITIVGLLGGNVVMDNLGEAYVTDARTIFSDVTSTITSDPIDIDGAGKVTVFLQETSTNMGTSTYTFQVSVDGTNYVTYNKLIDNVANSISQNITRVASKQFQSAGTALYDLDLSSGGYKHMKVINTIEGDATSTVKILVNY